MLTKIQCCAFVKMTPIQLAWQASLYLLILVCLFVSGVMHSGRGTSVEHYLADVSASVTTAQKELSIL